MESGASIGDQGWVEALDRALAILELWSCVE